MAKPSNLPPPVANAGSDASAPITNFRVVDIRQNRSVLQSLDAEASPLFWTGATGTWGSPTVAIPRRSVLAVPKDSNAWLSEQMSADYLGLIAPSSIRAAIERGDLVPDGRAGPDGEYLFRPATLDAYASRWATPKAPAASNDAPALPAYRKQGVKPGAPTPAPGQAWMTTAEAATYLRLGSSAAIRVLISPALIRFRRGIEK